VAVGAYHQCSGRVIDLLHNDIQVILAPSGPGPLLLAISEPQSQRRIDIFSMCRIEAVPHLA
jgi:hypothetical protein